MAPNGPQRHTSLIGVYYWAKTTGQLNNGEGRPLLSNQRIISTFSTKGEDVHTSARTSLKAPCVGSFLWENNAAGALSLSGSSRLPRLSSPGTEKRKMGEWERTRVTAGLSMSKLPSAINISINDEGLSFPLQVHLRCERQTLWHAVLQLSSPNMLGCPSLQPGRQGCTPTLQLWVTIQQWKREEPMWPVSRAAFDLLAAQKQAAKKSCVFFCHSTSYVGGFVSGSRGQAYPSTPQAVTCDPGQLHSG